MDPPVQSYEFETGSRLAGQIGEITWAAGKYTLNGSTQAFSRGVECLSTESDLVALNAVIPLEADSPMSAGASTRR